MNKTIIKVITFWLLLITVDGLGQHGFNMRIETDYGPHDIGYKTMYTVDVSRPALTDQGLIGKVIADHSHKYDGRQIQISIWYPSVKNAKATRMLFKEYSWELAREIDFDNLNDQHKVIGEKKFLDFITLDMDGKQEESEIASLLEVTTQAVRNAEPAGGKFPVLIIPAWRSPTAESIMAEYLASHGFVVAATTLKGTDSTLPEISSRGISSQTNDIAWVTNALKILPFANIDKLALMGTGINATACMAYISEYNRASAYISLDGGILAQNEKNLLQQLPYYDPSALKIPMLFIYSPHPTIQSSTVDDIKNATKHFVHFPATAEYYYLNFGVFEKLVPGILGDAPTQATPSHTWAAQVVMEFLKSVFLNTQSSMSQIVAKIPPAIGATYVVQQPLVDLPTLYEWKIRLASQEGTELLHWYDSIKGINAQPYTTRFLNDLFNWLGFRRDNDFSKREALLKLWHASYPNSSRGYFAAARLYGAKGDIDLAKENYKMALNFLNIDEDPYLDNITRQRILTLSNQVLGK